MRFTVTMLERCLARAIQIIRHPGLEYIEFQGGCIPIAIALWLLLPLRAPAGAAVDALGEVLDLDLFCAIAFAVGIFQLTAVLIGHVRLRRLASMAAVLFWIFTAIIVSLDHRRLLATPILFMFVAQAAYGFWLAGNDEHQS